MSYMVYADASGAAKEHFAMGCTLLGPDMMQRGIGLWQGDPPSAIKPMS